MDPYAILKVSPSASDDQVKAAYREMVKKYHPDNYKDNPLEDLAQEKLKEINEAYEEIQRQRGTGSGGRRGYNPGYSGYGQQRGYQQQQQRRPYTGPYAAVRASIERGDIAAAEEELNRAEDRGAEWHFLMGAVCYKKGWYDEASKYFSQAAAMDPQNPEYAHAVHSMRGGTAWGNANEQQLCNCCTSMMCANCLCNCLGGRLCC
jgi:curved DNA-binding protein CbpA